jgi:hypothetical protein
MSDNTHSVKQHGSVEKDPRTGPDAAYRTLPKTQFTLPMLRRPERHTVLPHVRGFSGNAIPSELDSRA